MTQYILTYFGGNPPATPEEGKAHFARYQAWLGELGEAVISAMNPIKDVHTIAPDGQVTAASHTGMSGYTLLEADSMDAALQMARSCPFLAIGGTLEVAEKISMG